MHDLSFLNEQFIQTKNVNSLPLTLQSGPELEVLLLQISPKDNIIKGTDFAMA
jgi:hypothetical protein